MIKNVVFDIGGVLADYRLKEFLFAKGFDGPMIKRLLKASIMSPYWEAFERADIDEDQALAGFASLDPDIEDDLRTAFQDCSGMLVPRDFAVSWVQSLKAQGLGVYWLSNYSSKAFHECADTLEFTKYADGGCLSFQEHLTKPDPAFFQLFLDRFGLSAQDCAFVDDTPANVEVACSLGFRGIVYDTYEGVQEQIAALIR